MKDEIVLVDWRKMTTLLLRAVLLGEDLKEIKEDAVVKHRLYAFEKELFAAIGKTGLTHLPRAVALPLQRLAADGLADRIADVLASFAGAITGKR